MEKIGRLFEKITDRIALVILINLAVLSFALSAWSHLRSGEVNWSVWADGAFQNLGTEMMGAIITFALFELVIGVRDKKEGLISRLRSRNNADAGIAIQQLRDKHWLQDGTLQGINLEAAKFNKVDLRGANLKGANLRFVQLNSAILWEANLAHADLTRATLTMSYLAKADLRGVLLIAADLQGADLRYANLKGANLSGATLYNADITGAEFDEHTILPDAHSILGEDDGVLTDSEGNFVFTPQSYYIPGQTDMTRYTNPEHEDFRTIWRSY